MCKEIILVMTIVSALFVASIVKAEGELIPDFYEEPGAGNGEVSVDPFSGSLRLSYLDISLPGNGGMDINIHRSYTNPQDKLGARRVTGTGWSIHFGRVMIIDRTKLCSVHNGPAETVLDNPMVELPDGSMQQLFYADFESSRWISSDRWKADCVDGANGILLTSPEGMQYTMDQYASDDHMVPGTPVNVWYTSKITDRHGNEINITYTSGGAFGGYRLVDTVTSFYPGASLSENRLVEFKYTNQSTSKVLLSEITSHGQTWVYEYTEIPGGGWPGLDWLTKVIRPDGSEFNYSYYPALANAGSYAMHEITYPYGAVESFTYGYMSFDSSDYSHSTVVTSKSQSGRDIEAGIWTYTYAPGSAGAPYDLDVTTITSPNGVQVFENIGAVAAYNHGLLYAVGLPGTQKNYDLLGNLIQQTSYEWAFQVISLEDVYRPTRPNFRSKKTVVPISLAQTTWRESVNHETRYSPLDHNYLNNFDHYGNPLVQTETGTYDSRVTEFNYFHEVYGTGKWLIKQVKDETIKSAGKVNGVSVDASTIRTFDLAGNLLQENKYGVTTDFTYYLTGDMKTTTNARGFKTTYDNYKRGTPQVENHPEGVVLSRAVNDRGTISSETNGRGYTSSYLYDNFDRLTNINLPINSDASITYNPRGKALVRGNYLESTLLDGFGRPVCVIKRDIVTGASILQQTRYNAVGQKVFESYPADSEDCNASLQGTTFEYDVLDRLIRATHPDSTYKQLEYLVGNQVSDTNERGVVNNYFYASYGNPDEKYLVRLDAPENITNLIANNKLGQKTYVWQGDTDRFGYKRDYIYDSRFFLSAIDHPETGLTEHGLDETGNIVSKKVGTSDITYYSYDGLNRQTLIDYPNATPDVTFTYDDNNNIESVNNSSSQRSYVYDKNDNLRSESIVTGNRTSVLSYQYDNLDNLTTLTYPTEREVNYVPDALGRASQVAPFVSDVTYYPSGQLRRLAYANGQVTDYQLNSRLWVEQIQASGVSNAVDYTYGYDVVGNVSSIADGLEPVYDLALAYDGADRLTVANGIWGSGSFSYDFNGNFKTKTIGSANANYNIHKNRLASVSESGLKFYSYDSYGNITNNGKHNFIYDDAGNLTSSTLVSGFSSSTYFDYDGNNMRVQRTLDADLTQYVYATNGNLIGEHGELPADDKENIYLGSKMVASVKGTPVPVANAGSDQLANEGSLVALDGRLSTTRYGTIVNYAWTQLSGPSITLSSSIASTPTFIAPTAVYSASLLFQLTVTNTAGNTSVDTVSIDVQIVDVDSDGLSDYWETLNFSNLMRTAVGDEDGDGYSNIEEYQSGSDPVAPAPLGLITDIEVLSRNAQNTLSWSSVPRALAYDLYWSETSGVTQLNGSLVSDVASPYEHSGLNNNQPYYYLLVARNVCCESVSQEVNGTPRRTLGLSEWSSHFAGEIGYGEHAAIGGYVGGKAMLISLSYSTGNNSVIIHTYDRTSGLVTSETIVQSDTSLYYLHSPDIVQAADGSAIVVWVSREASSGITSVMAKHFTPGSGWGESLSIWSNSAQGVIGKSSFHNYGLQAEIDQDGNMTLVWGNTDSNLTALYSTRYLKNSGWDVITQLNLPLNINGAYFDMASTGYAAVAYSTVPVNQVGQYFVRRYVPGSGWLESELISTDPTLPVEKVKVSDQGDVAVFWVYPRYYIDYSCQLIVKRYHPVTGWNRAEDTFLCRNYFKGPVKAAYDSNRDLLVVIPTSFGDPGVLTILYKKYVSGAGWRQTGAIPSTSNIEGMGFFSKFFGYGYELLPDDYGNVSLFLHEYGGSSDWWSKPDSVRIIQHVITGDNELKSVVLSTLSHNRSTGFGNDLNFAASDNGDILAMSVLSGAGGNRVTVSELIQYPGAPHANAGAQQSVDSGDLVTLDGSGSSDSDGVVATYTWRQLAGTPVSLSSADGVSPSFTAPSVIEQTNLVFELLVEDDAGLVGIDSVTIAVFPPNAPPVANAGGDLIVNEASDLILDGNSSYDIDGSIVSYRWQQLTEPFVTINFSPGGEGSGSSSAIGFTAPWLQQNKITDLRLTVTDDGGKTASDVVSVTVLDVMTQPPVADAGGNRYVDEFRNALLDGSGSFGTEGTIISHAWTQTAGPAVTLNGADTDTAIFLTPEVTSDTLFTFVLTVTDSFGMSATDSVNVTVREPPPPPPSSDVTPPVTTVNTSRSGIYYGIAFNVNEAASTFFRVRGDATIISGGVNTDVWYLSIDPLAVRVDGPNTVILEYYSVDFAGNAESVQSKVLP